LSVPDEAGGGDDAQIKEVALGRSVEDVARVGYGGDGFGEGKELSAGDVVAFAILKRERKRGGGRLERDDGNEMDRRDSL
jgi:hypothetical protein